VVDVKDLGSGVIHGKECDHLAFRTKEFDWQIWIAQGEAPHPCRYIITSTMIDQAPQYTLEFTSFRTGEQARVDDFAFSAPADAKKLTAEDIRTMKGVDEMPSNFTLGAAK
jgi:hypothetical protein